MSGLAMLIVLYGSLVVTTWLLLTINASLPVSFKPSETTSVACVVEDALLGCVVAPGLSCASATDEPPLNIRAPIRKRPTVVRAADWIRVRLITVPFGVLK